ncbi:UNVERIFIED_CONTAM: hypothetical protein K2H54_061121 [Gekko kuhli]
MACGGPVRELCEEVTCPICLEYFMDPATIAECGHNFCRACLTRSWGESAEASCPVCKQTVWLRNLRPNRQLANIVEITRKLSLEGGEGRQEGARERICEKHRKPLKLFCRTDEILICGACKRTKKHKCHEVTPAEEASREYKDMIFNCLEILRNKREKILLSMEGAEYDSEEMLRRTESERQKRVADFKTLCQLLNEQKKDLLAQIEETEKEIAGKRGEHLVRLSQEFSSLESLIQEMEEKLQQSGSELLQDVRGTLQRYEKKETFENPMAFPRVLRMRVDYCRYNPFLEEAMKQFKDTLAWAFPKLRATVTLDPASASSRLVLYGDQKNVRWERTIEDLPGDPEKHYGFVLGSEGFTAGCHFWDVLVGSSVDWAVGVARKPVKGRITLTPEEGIWAVGCLEDQYQAFIEGKTPPLTLRDGPDLIRVCLNYDGGRVAFFDADTAALLYEFSGASFSGETIYPIFVLYEDGDLSINV